jgi:hypothetical protein
VSAGVPGSTYVVVVEVVVEVVGMVTVLPVVDERTPTPRDGRGHIVTSTRTRRRAED